MKRVFLSILLTAPFLLLFSAADNGVEGISDICVECLKTVQLFKNITCIKHSTATNVLLCGAYRITKGFYVDCWSAMQTQPTAWNTWVKCYESDECGAECVKAYHNRFASNCQSVLPDKNAQLQCRDYGQIHYGGPNSCGNPDLTAVDFITNMTLLCGCETVTGNRSECLKQLTKPDSTEKQNDFLKALIIVAAISFVIIVIIIIIAVCCYQNKQTPHHLRDKDRVVSQRFRNMPEASAVSPTVTSEAVQKRLMQDSSSTPQHEILIVETSSPALGPRTGNKAASVPADDISLSMTKNVPVASEAPPAYEQDYINASYGQAREGRSSCSSNSSTLENKIRAPIPVPR